MQKYTINNNKQFRKSTMFSFQISIYKSTPQTGLQSTIYTLQELKKLSTIYKFPCPLVYNLQAKFWLNLHSGITRDVYSSRKLAQGGGREIMGTFEEPKGGTLG